MVVKDYILAINEANQFIDQMQGTSEAEEMHYLILKAVRIQLQKSGPDRNQTWTEYALGIQGKQHALNPYFMRLSYASYLKAYPDGKYAAEIKIWQQEARDTLCDHYMTVGRYYYEKGHYLAAVLRYAIILEWGAGIRSFPEALYETIRTQWDFAKALRDPKKIPNDRFLELMRTQDTALLKQRTSIADQTREEALQLLQKMKENLPHSEWTKKATAWIQKG